MQMLSEEVETLVPRAHPLFELVLLLAVARKVERKQQEPEFHSFVDEGFTEQTYYRWKAKYGGMDSSEAKKLKQLEDENRKLKHVVADLTLDNRALKDVLSKNW